MCRTSRLVTSLLGAAFGLAACGIASLERPALATLPATPAVTADGPRAATNLSGESLCSETELRKAIARLRWTPAQTRGREQRVEVTVRRDGFAAADTQSSGPLAPEVATFTWDKVSAGIIHYWRVVTVHADASVPSETAEFKGEVCVADFQPSPSPGTATATPASRTPVPGGKSPSPTVVSGQGSPSPSATATAEPAAVAAAGATPAARPLFDVTSRESSPVVAAALGAAALLGIAIWWRRRRV